MKKISTLLVLTSVYFFIACINKNKNVATPSTSENLVLANTYKEKIWESGLIDHELRNMEVAPTPVMQVSFKDVQNIKYGANPVMVDGTHYKIENTSTNLLFQKIKQYINQIDGIFLGVSISGTSLNPKEELFISLAVVDSVRLKTNPNCAVDRMTFFKTQQVTVNFKCVDRNKGTWALIPETDPIIANFKKNKKGVFIGKNNLFNNIFRKTKIMYLYTGTYLAERHYVAVDYPYFSPANTINVGANNNNLSFYLSSLKSLPAPQCANLNYFAHGTSRLCPSNCPQ